LATNCFAILIEIREEFNSSLIFLFFFFTFLEFFLGFFKFFFAFLSFFFAFFSLLKRGVNLNERFFRFLFHLHIFFLLKSVQKLSAPNFVVIKKMLYLCKQNFNDNKKAFLLIFGLFETWTISNRMPNK
jgi:hypothetical protein